MAFDLPWKKKKVAGGAGGTNGGAAVGGGDSDNSKNYPTDAVKARKWFDRAQTVADSRQYDYAIDSYIAGLKFDPEKLSSHEALYEVARRREVNSGKALSMIEKMKLPRGKEPIERMLREETVWAKDPGDLDQLVAVMEQAVEGNDAYANIDMSEVVFWLGERALESALNPKNKVSKKTYLKITELLARVGAFDKAVDACRRALNIDSDDPVVLQRMKDLEAERTMMIANYGNKGEDGFRSSVKDVEKQHMLDGADQIVRTENVQDKLIEMRRKEHEENPADLDKMQKLVTELEKKATLESENEALSLLKKAWEDTGAYKWKLAAGNIRMKQFGRAFRDADTAFRENPSEENKATRQTIARERFAFELTEYTERAKNYPTEMRWRFELGKRYHQIKKYDEAIAAFQEAQGDPKVRIASQEYLGDSYFHKEWFDESIQTLEKARDAYAMTDDPQALRLRYKLMIAELALARKNRSIEHAKKAQGHASQILQSDINFMDIRAKMDEIKKLIDELQKPV